MAAAPAAAPASPQGLPLLPSQRVERFLRSLRHSTGEWAGMPFELEPWQRDHVVRPIFDTLERNGLRRYREALIGVAKKNGKTSLAAGLGLYALFADGRYVKRAGAWGWAPEYGAEVYNVAATREQAGILFEIGRGYVLSSPLLRPHVKPYRDALEVKDTGSVWRVLAADARHAHGYNPSVAIIDEIWAHKGPELYEAFASAGAARAQPLVLTITTAGYEQNGVAYALYKRHRARTGGVRFYSRWWEPPAGAAIDNTRAWRAANPSRWVTVAYLREELQRARVLGMEDEFRRFHLNQWTSTRRHAIPPELWDGCRRRPVMPAGTPVYVAVDPASRRDSTAVAVARIDDDGVTHAQVRVFEVERAGEMVDFEAVADHLVALTRQFDVQVVDYDDTGGRFTATMQEVEELTGVPVRPFPQSDTRMVPASTHLYELLAERKLRHGGAPKLREAAMNAAAVTTERGWRVKKLRSGALIDALVALIMAAYAAAHLPVEEAPAPGLYV